MQNAMPGLLSARALMSALDRSHLDAGAKAAVVDAVDASMPTPAPNAPDEGYNRRQFRAALAWMRGAAGRIKLARLASERSRGRKRLGAFERRRPKARRTTPYQADARGV